MHIQEIRLPNGVALAIAPATKPEEYADGVVELCEKFCREVDTEVMSPEAVVLKVHNWRHDMLLLAIRLGMVERIY